MTPRYQPYAYKPWLITEVHDRGPGQVYRYEVVGFNLLCNLYHLARTALAGQGDTQHARMQWAAKWYAKAHPEVSSTGAYKALSRELETGR